MTNTDGGNGYYDYVPTLTLDKPLVFNGPPSGEHREIAYNLAAVTGLRLDDTDRLVEHRAGRSLWEVLRDTEVEVYRRWESSFLYKAIEARPSGIVVVGDGALADPANRSIVAQRACLLHLDLPLNSVFWNMRRQTRPHPFFPSPPETPDALEALFAAYQAGGAPADIRLDLENREAHRLTLELRDRLAAQNNT